jgi:hypothetical protein
MLFVVYTWSITVLIIFGNEEESEQQTTKEERLREGKGRLHVAPLDYKLSSEPRRHQNMGFL